MKKIYTYLIFSFALLCSTSLIAQTNEKARETAVMIADRILKSTTYDFVDKKSGKTYTSLKNVPLNKNVKVQSKYLDWHYTNGVTNIALMELGDKLGTSKYENYVLKNMNFIFDDANQDYFHRLYDQTLEQEGWRAVNHVNWHMIYRNKRLDDNGPMGASLIVLNRRHPKQAFQKYIDQTDHHLMVSEPRLADGTIARLWPHVNTIWADDAFMALSFLVRMGEATGDAKYFDATCGAPKKDCTIIAITRITRRMALPIGPGQTDGFSWLLPICWHECPPTIRCVKMSFGTSVCRRTD